MADYVGHRRDPFSRSFECLPDTTLCQIISFLPHAKSQACLASTCKRFLELTSRSESLEFLADDFQYVELSQIPFIVTRAVMNLQNLRRLKIEVPSRSSKFQEFSFMVWCIHSRDSLQYLTLIDTPDDPQYKDRLPSQEWKLEHASSCTKLETLDLYNVYMDYPRKLECRTFSHLRYLAFQQVSIVGELLADLLQYCPVLEELLLISCAGIGSLNLEETSLTHLKRFELVVSDIACPGCLELFRINAPYLETLILVVDCLPVHSHHGDDDMEVMRTVEILDGRLRVLQLDLTAPFHLKVNPDAIQRLERLLVLGDDWPWSVVDELLQVSCHNLNILTLGASCIMEDSGPDPSEFFRAFPCLEYLSLGPELFYILCRNLKPMASISSGHLKEIHVEYLSHNIEEAHFAAALLKGCPNLRLIQPIYSTMSQVQGNSQQWDKEFRAIMAQLLDQYPHVKFPKF